MFASSLRYASLARCNPNSWIQWLAWLLVGWLQAPGQRRRRYAGRIRKGKRPLHHHLSRMFKITWITLPQHKSAPFKIADHFRWTVILGSREHIEEVLRAPEQVLSFMEGTADVSDCPSFRGFTYTECLLTAAQQ